MSEKEVVLQSDGPGKLRIHYKENKFTLISIQWHLIQYEFNFSGDYILK